MDAFDTMMNTKQIDEARLKGYQWNNTEGRSLLEVQAMISFEAGYEEAMRRMAIEAQKIIDNTSLTYRLVVIAYYEVLQDRLKEQEIK